MNNQQLIKSAHIWFLALFLVCGLLVIAGKAGMRIQDQNQNSNQNSNSNSNSNSNRAQNSNENRANQNTGATGEQAGMASMSSQDRKFVMDAAMGGMMEVELGRIAAQQGASEGVKQFGQRMVDDHSKANTELMSLASSKGITLPTALDDKQRREVTKLSAMSGAEFDRAYIKRMVSDHKKKLSTFERESTRGVDPDLKAFASKTLPTVQEHLQMANALEGSQGSNSNSSGNRNSNSNNSNSNRP